MSTSVVRIPCRFVVIGEMMATAWSQKVARPQSSTDCPKDRIEFRRVVHSSG
jgi:hypothetical protein